MKIVPLREALMTSIALGHYDTLPMLIDHLLEEGDPHGDHLLRAYSTGDIHISNMHPGQESWHGSSWATQNGGFKNTADGYGLGYSIPYGPKWAHAGEMHDARPLHTVLPLFLQHAETSDRALHGFANYLEMTGHKAALAFRKALGKGVERVDGYLDMDKPIAHGVTLVKHPESEWPSAPRVTEWHHADGVAGHFSHDRHVLLYRLPHHTDEAPTKLARQPFTQSLGVALASLNSKNNTEKLKALRTLLAHAEEHGQVHPTIHHSPETGFVPAATVTLEGTADAATPAIASYLASWTALLQQHPRVVAFHPHPEGADSLHSVTGGNMKELAEMLLSAGVPRFILSRSGATVFDAGSRFNPSTFGGKVHTIRGVGQLVGTPGKFGPEARAAHRDAIRAHEGQVLKLARHVVTQGGIPEVQIHAEPGPHPLTQTRLVHRVIPLSGSTHISFQTKDGKQTAYRERPGRPPEAGEFTEEHGYRAFPLTMQDPVQPLRGFEKHGAWPALTHWLGERLPFEADEHLRQYARERSEDEGHPVYVHQWDATTHSGSVKPHKVTEYHYIPTETELTIRHLPDRHRMWFQHGMTGGPMLDVFDKEPEVAPHGTLNSGRTYATAHVVDPEFHAILNGIAREPSMPYFLDYLLEHAGNPKYAKLAEAIQKHYPFHAETQTHARLD